MDEPTRACVAQLRARVKAAGLVIRPSYLDTEVFLARFARARRNDAEASWSMLEACLAWRESKRVHEVVTWFGDSPKGRALLGFWPNAVSGVRGDRLVVHEHMTLLEPQALLDDGFELEDLLDLHVFLVERDLRRLAELSAERNAPMTQIVVVENMAGLGLRHLGSSVIDLLKATLALDEANYPELLGAMVIINAPAVVSIGFRMMRPFIDANTLAKIHIHGCDWASSEPLQSVLSSDDVCREWGGSSSTFQWSLSGAPAARTEEDDCEEIAVGAQSDAVREIAVAVEGSALYWQCSVADKDVGLDVTLLVGNKKPRQLVGPCRVASGLPEGGVVQNLPKGVVRVVLDNTYSLITAKQVSLLASVRPPAKKKGRKKRNHKKKQ